MRAIWKADDGSQMFRLRFIKEAFQKDLISRLHKVRLIKGWLSRKNILTSIHLG